MDALPKIEDGRDEWVAWLAAHLQQQWPQAKLRADVKGYTNPGVRRGVMPDVEFWYPNDAGVFTLRHLYRILPAGLLNTRDAIDDLAALLAYCRANARQLTLVVPDRALTREEIEALDSALAGTLSPMLFEVASYMIE